MGTLLSRRRYMGGSNKGAPVNINVKTHSGGSVSLDIITGDGEPVNIKYTTVLKFPWTNGYIQVAYHRTLYSWRLFAETSCLYNGQIYNSGDLITTWSYTETKDINIVANI